MTCSERSRRIDLNGIKVKNRILWAAGVWGYGEGWPWERWLTRIKIPGYGRLADPASAGAVITKTLTLESRQGGYIDPFEFERRSPTSHLSHLFSEERKQVLRKVPGGWINNMQWWNVGIDYWIREIYPKIEGDIVVIPNIGGYIADHYTKLIHKLNPLRIAAIELNISCPNVRNPLEKNPEELVKLFAFCRAVSLHPLIVKLGVSCDYLRIARIAEYCGINAISAINAVPALGGPPRRGEARSIWLSGGYSGKAIKPIALKVVSDLKKETNLPVIGGGGITSLKDCQDFLEVADAIALGSVGFNPLKPTWIVKRHRTCYY